MSANASEYFAHRKRRCEEQLKDVETTGLRIFRTVVGGAQQEITDSYKDELREHVKAYQRAIDFLEGKSTPLPPSNKGYNIK